MNNSSEFTAIDENGIESTYKMLYCKTIDNKSIIWYTDGSIDKNGKYNIYISSYKKVDKKFILDSIDNEMEMQKYINVFKQELLIK